MPDPVPTPAVVAAPLPSGRTVHFNTAALSTILSALLGMIATYVATRTNVAPASAPVAVASPAVPPTPAAPAPIVPPAPPASLYLTLIADGTQTPTSKALASHVAGVNLPCLVVQTNEGQVVYADKVPATVAELVGLMKRLRGP